MNSKNVDSSLEENNDQTTLFIFYHIFAVNFKKKLKFVKCRTQMFN